MEIERLEEEKAEKLEIGEPLIEIERRSEERGKSGNWLREREIRRLEGKEGKEIERREG